MACASPSQVNGTVRIGWASQKVTSEEFDDEDPGCYRIWSLEGGQAPTFMVNYDGWAQELRSEQGAPLWSTTGER